MRGLKIIQFKKYFERLLKSWSGLFQTSVNFLLPLYTVTVITYILKGSGTILDMAIWIIWTMGPFCLDKLGGPDVTLV